MTYEELLAEGLIEPKAYDAMSNGEVTDDFGVPAGGDAPVILPRRQEPRQEMSALDDLYGLIGAPGENPVQTTATERPALEVPDGTSAEGSVPFRHDKSIVGPISDRLIGAGLTKQDDLVRALEAKYGEGRARLHGNDVLVDYEGEGAFGYYNKPGVWNPLELIPARALYNAVTGNFDRTSNAASDIAGDVVSITPELAGAAGSIVGAIGGGAAGTTLGPVGTIAGGAAGAGTVGTAAEEAVGRLLREMTGAEDTRGWGEYANDTAVKFGFNAAGELAGPALRAGWNGLKTGVSKLVVDPTATASGLSFAEDAARAFEGVGMNDQMHVGHVARPGIRGWALGLENMPVGGGTLRESREGISGSIVDRFSDLMSGEGRVANAFDEAFGAEAAARSASERLIGTHRGAVEAADQAMSERSALTGGRMAFPRAAAKEADDYANSSKPLYGLLQASRAARMNADAGARSQLQTELGRNQNPGGIAGLISALRRSGNPGTNPRQVAGYDRLRALADAAQAAPENFGRSSRSLRAELARAAPEGSATEAKRQVAAEVGKDGISEMSQSGNVPALDLAALLKLGDDSVDMAASGADLDAIRGFRSAIDTDAANALGDDYGTYRALQETLADATRTKGGAANTLRELGGSATSARDASAAMKEGLTGQRHVYDNADQAKLARFFNAPSIDTLQGLNDLVVKGALSRDEAIMAVRRAALDTGKDTAGKVNLNNIGKAVVGDDGLARRSQSVPDDVIDLIDAIYSGTGAGKAFGTNDWGTAVRSGSRDGSSGMSQERNRLREFMEVIGRSFEPANAERVTPTSANRISSDFTTLGRAPTALSSGNSNAIARLLSMIAGPLASKAITSSGNATKAVRSAASQRVREQAGIGAFGTLSNDASRRAVSSPRLDDIAGAFGAAPGREGRSIGDFAEPLNGVLQSLLRRARGEPQPGASAADASSLADLVSRNLGGSRKLDTVRTASEDGARLRSGTLERNELETLADLLDVGRKTVRRNGKTNLKASEAAIATQRVNTNSDTRREKRRGIGE